MLVAHIGAPGRIRSPNNFWTPDCGFVSRKYGWCSVVVPIIFGGGLRLLILQDRKSGVAFRPCQKVWRGLAKRFGGGPLLQDGSRRFLGASPGPLGSGQEPPGLGLVWGRPAVFLAGVLR